MKSKKSILCLLLLTVLCCLSCGYCDEGKTIDITVMPPATTVGAQIFGRLIDGGAYIGKPVKLEEQP